MRLEQKRPKDFTLVQMTMNMMPITNDDDANDDKEDNDELHLGAVDLLLPTPAAFLWARQVGFHLMIIITKINCHHHQNY